MPELGEKLLRNIATTVATANLGSSSVSVVNIAPTTDSAGDAALRVTIVFTPGSTDAISGDAALNTLVQLQHALQNEGEDRFPIVEYATEDELKAGAD
jgi:hypothetical protein